MTVQTTSPDEDPQWRRLLAQLLQAVKRMLAEARYSFRRDDDGWSFEIGS